jgi:hypothetical protein
MNRPGCCDPGALTAAIFDVDGVLLASPDERAWRDAHEGFAEPDRFATAMYQAEVAGKPASAAPAPPSMHWACRTAGAPMSLTVSGEAHELRGDRAAGLRGNAAGSEDVRGGERAARRLSRVGVVSGR